jgi:hypothetical protein
MLLRQCLRSAPGADEPAAVATSAAASASAGPR